MNIKKIKDTQVHKIDFIYQRLNDFKSTNKILYHYKIPASF